MPRQCRMPQLSPMSSVGAPHAAPVPYATVIPDRHALLRPKNEPNVTPATIFSALNSLNNG
jgi:hypothetical protein